MRKSFQFRVYPTVRQTQLLDKMLNHQRLLYNHLLEQRITEYRDNGKSLTKYDQIKYVTQIKKTAEWEFLNRWSAGMSQETAMRLDRAFQAFFRRVKSGDKPGFPRFRGRGWFNSVRLDTGKGGVIFDSQSMHRNTQSFKHKRSQRTALTLYVQGVGHVKVQQHRELQGRPTTIDVKRTNTGKWFCTVSCKDIEPESLPSTGNELGIDLGITNFITTSDGKFFDHQKLSDNNKTKSDELHRSISRKKKGSRNRHRARFKLAKLKERERNQKVDWQRKTAKSLVDFNDVIYVEDLSIKQMLKQKHKQLNKKGKRTLNRHISDVAWGQFISILTNKAESAGRYVVLVNPRHTSQMCNQCKTICADNRKGEKFKCLSCGYSTHADINAAQNIKDRGQGMTSLDGSLVLVSASTG